MKKLALLMMIGGAVAFSSCKKKGCTDSKATNYDSKAKKDDGSCKYPAPVTFCLPDAINGTYVGTGTLNNVPNQNITLVITKQSCESCKIVADSTIVENVVDLTESSSGGYVGKDADNNSVSITLNGNSINVSTDEIDFSGSK